MMDAIAAFDADARLLPSWVQVWMDTIGLVLIVSVVVLLIGRSTRMLGLYLLVSTLLSFVILVWMHSQMGMVRLLGISHIVLWTPMVIYIWHRLKTDPPGRFYAAVMGILMVVIFVALVFDYYDTTRFIMGQRAPIV